MPLSEITQNEISKIESATQLTEILREYATKFSKEHTSGGFADSVVTESPFLKMKQTQIMENIISEFNQNRPSIITKALQWLGFLINLLFKPFRRIEPGKMQLVSRNNIPELVAANSALQRINITLNPYNTSVDHGIYDQNNPLIGAFGHYVLNVPLGHYAKVSFGNENMLYGEGQHVIHNQNFTVPTDYLVKVYAPYIQHKDIHVFNVRPGYYAKITIGTDYYLLPPGNHQIRNANLIFNEKEDYVLQTSVYIHHGNLHLLNIPKGKMALVLDNNIPKILMGGQHVINNANFKFDVQTMLLPQNQSYIAHQNIHYITVTPGHIALISIDNETIILPSRTEPYIFQSNNFSIYSKNGQYTFDESTKHISFNGKHYLLPDQGEVAVLYDGAELIIRPDAQQQKEEEHAALDNHQTKAFIINSGTARFAEFLDTRTQTLEFPSNEVVKQRVSEGQDKHTSRFDKFKTADNVNVAVRFVVTYRITDPKKALQSLKSRAEIERHIETLVNADMGNAIGNTTSSHLMSSEQSKARRPVEGKEEGQEKSSDNPAFWQDKVKNTLHEDLLEVGIELGRLNIEETFILDESVRKKMEEQSITATTAQAEMSILQTQNNLAERKALQERKMQQYYEETKAATERIKADLALKQAELQTEMAQTVVDREMGIATSKIKAQLSQQVLQAQAEQQIKILQAEGDLAAKQKEAEGAQAMLSSQQVTAKILQENPAMLQLEVAKLLAEALKGSQYLPVVSLLSNGNPVTLMTNLLRNLSGQENLGKETPVQMLQQRGLFAVPTETTSTEKLGPILVQ